MRVTICLLVAVVCSLAQAVESPLSFDGSGEIMALTPTLNRKAGIFPDLVEFDRVELWQTEAGPVAETYFEDGTRQRRSLTEHELRQVRERVAAQLEKSPPSVRLNQEGRGSFLIQQIPLALGWYGTALSALVADYSFRWTAGVYLLGSSACYFGPLMMTSNAPMTHAQAHLSVAYGYRGILTGSLISLTFEFESHRPCMTTMLATSIGGQVLGYKLARDMSTGQAGLVSAYTDHGTVDGFLLGAGVATLCFDDDLPQQSFTIAALLGQAVGGVVGVARARAWDCTEGQVHVHRTAGLLGAAVPVALYASAVGFDFEWDGHVPIMMTLGLAGNVAGIWWIEQDIRETHFSNGNGLIVAGTTIGGALLGAGLGFVAFPEEPRVFVAGGAAGGVAGFLGGLKLARGLQADQAGRASGSRIEVNYTTLAAAAAEFASSGSFTAPNLVTVRF